MRKVVCTKVSRPPSLPLVKYDDHVPIHSTPLCTGTTLSPDLLRTTPGLMSRITFLRTERVGHQTMTGGGPRPINCKSTKPKEKGEIAKNLGILNWDEGRDLLWFLERVRFCDTLSGALTYRRLVLTCLVPNTRFHIRQSFWRSKWQRSRWDTPPLPSNGR